MNYSLLLKDFQKTAKENAEYLQGIIDECSSLGGGEIIFPKGEILLCTVFLKNNVHLVFQDGTKILGSLDFYDYMPDEKVDYPLYQDASHSFFHCSMFVAENCDNISFSGRGMIDMRSIWDEDNVRNIVHRGAKCIALKNCKNVLIADLGIYNVTDLAVYFAGCENVEVCNIKMRVYIDGISPDNCKNVKIHDCDIETGDDGIVFKSSYTLNRLDECENISVWDCKVKSRCSAIKFGTETNGGFRNITIDNIFVYESRITGIAIESVDGAIIDGLLLRNITMKNVGAPLFIHLGKRMRGPKGRKVGKIKNITLENISASGPYEPYDVIAWNYLTYKAGNFKQYPWKIGLPDLEDYESADSDWQITSNVCGLNGNKLENIILKNIDFELDGGVGSYNNVVSDEPPEYPEVFVYGRILPAKGIFFRHIDGLTLDNVKIKTYRPDVREDFIFVDVDNLSIN